MIYMMANDGKGTKTYLYKIDDKIEAQKEISEISITVQQLFGLQTKSTISDNWVSLKFVKSLDEDDKGSFSYDDNAIKALIQSRVKRQIEFYE